MIHALLGESGKLLLSISTWQCILHAAASCLVFFFLLVQYSLVSTIIIPGTT